MPLAELAGSISIEILMTSAHAESWCWRCFSAWVFFYSYWYAAAEQGTLHNAMIEANLDSTRVCAVNTCNCRVAFFPAYIRWSGANVVAIVTMPLSELVWAHQGL